MSTPGHNSLPQWGVIEAMTIQRFRILLHWESMLALVLVIEAT